MHPSKDLHELVRSLTRSEKRCINMRAAFHRGNKHYLMLLSWLEDQEVFDSKELFQSSKFWKSWSHSNRMVTNGSKFGWGLGFCIHGMNAAATRMSPRWGWARELPGS